MASLINKARKPKFELHLTIYDLNNVPLATGISLVKWHLPYSMHGEHRGRTAKCPIDSQSHRVTYSYSKIVPLRITIDRNNNLTECPIVFEVVQEFPVTNGGREEKMTLGEFTLNLSEYVEESENFPRRSRDFSARGKRSLEQAREKILGPALGGQRRLSTPTTGSGSSMAPSSPKSISASSMTATTTTLVGSDSGVVEEEQAEEGIVRRYLMQESKINSTIKVGILMIQIDGDRNFVAPPLKTGPMFSGFTGVKTGGEAAELVDDMASGGVPSIAAPSKASKDANDGHDMYRRTLTSSWLCHPGELPADECIEDIFAGGDGWTHPQGGSTDRKHHRRRRGDHGDGASSSTGEEMDNGTSRPSDVGKLSRHMRQHSGSSEKSMLTVVGRHGSHESRHSGYRALGRHHSREDSMFSSHSGFDGPHGMRSRSDSMASLAPTLGSLGDSERLDMFSRGREGFRRPREVDEFEVRDDLVSWALPGTVA